MTELTIRRPDDWHVHASENGARYYGLPLNHGTVTLRREPLPIPESIAVGATGDMIQPFRAGETLNWRMMEAE